VSYNNKDITTIFFKSKKSSYKNFSSKFTDLIFLEKLSYFYKNYLFQNFKRTFSFGFLYIRALLFIFFIDACLTDDEPLWEPIE
jgi:hypothetical protein